MKLGSLNIVRLASLFSLITLLAGLSCAGADAKINPYESIAERNPFHLKDPPPPPDPNEVPKGPPPVIPSVEVTGIFNMFHKKQAFLEIIPAPGKPVVRVTLSEGEKGEAIEVVSIDLEKNEVVLNNSGIVTNVPLKTASKSTGPAPGIPGLLIPPGPNPAAAYVPPNNTAYGVPNVNASGRASPMIMGANPPAAAHANPYGANPAYSTPGFTPTTPSGYNPGAFNPGSASASDFTKQIPPRQLRAQSTQPEVPVDPAVQYINMAVQKRQVEATGRPFPPLPPIPGLEQP